jgi:hypothetical protein
VTGSFPSRAIRSSFPFQSPLNHPEAGPWCLGCLGGVGFLSIWPAADSGRALVCVGRARHLARLHQKLGVGGRGDAQPARRVKIIADGTDWRFLDELKRELKT